MTKPGRFFWKLFLSNALLLSLALGISVWLIVREVEEDYRVNLTQRLLAQAVTVRHEVRDIFHHDRRAELQKTALEIGAIREADIRVTMIEADGTVIADSKAPPETMENHGARPEVVQALREGWGQAERRSDTIRSDMKYVAVRLDDARGHPLGTIRVAMPVPDITAQTTTMRRLIWQTASLGLAAAFVIALALAYVWSEPIRRITETARSLSLGDLSARTRVRGFDEIAQLAASLNQMRESIARQVLTIDRQRKNLEYLIRSLTEGVIVAGPDGKIVLMNEAVCRLLGDVAIEPSRTKPDSRHYPEPPNPGQGPVGKPVAEVIRNPQIREFLLSATRDSDADEAFNESAATRIGRAVREMRLQIEQPQGPVHILARCSEIGLPALENGASDASGRLVVLTDITELTRTIRMKTDFVANASHEFRTPLSIIRASIETLEQMNLVEDHQSAGQFINVIAKHSLRLEELVNDLLDLSRLESAATEFRPEEIQLEEFLGELTSRFAHSIEIKSLTIEVQCPDSTRVIVANGRLLRLVLDNLVANAIKFTDTGGHVSINAARLGASVSIEVRDDGCGIPKEDQDRVFERFYQVERARSGSGRQHPGERGTGLGLSIVRHAVAAMQGNVLLKSQVGKGTSVTLFIPQPE